MADTFVDQPWQPIGTKFIVDNPRCMLVADPGMGKTAMTLKALKILHMCGSSFFPALILAPKRVAEVVWDGEVRRWDVFKDLSVLKVIGEREARMAALKSSIADIYVCNYENAPWLVEQFGGSKWPFKIVVADESPRLKSFRLNKGGQRAEALGKIARFTGRWLNLTGTPMPNGEQDLWGQMWFVDFGERLKRSYTAYMDAYFKENPYSRKITCLPGQEAVIQELVKDRVMSLLAEDWLPLDKPQIIPVEVVLPPKALIQYKQMEKEFFTTVSEREIETAVEAGTAAAKSSKMMQIASGSIWDENSMPHKIHEAKVEGLADIVEQTNGAPLVVAYWWKFDPPRIIEAFPKAKVYSGPQDEAAFNAGKIPMLLLNWNSAYGLNLARNCRDLVCYSYWWNAELWTQMLDRIGPVRQYQVGKKCVVRIWQIIAQDTIDDGVIASNARKITMETAFKRARARRKNGEQTDVA